MTPREADEIVAQTLSKFRSGPLAGVQLERDARREDRWDRALTWLLRLIVAGCAVTVAVQMWRVMA